MTLRAVSSEQPTRDRAPELDAPIVSSTDLTSTKYRIAALTYLRDEPTESDFRQAEIHALLAIAAATSELAAATAAQSVRLDLEGAPTPEVTWPKGLTALYRTAGGATVRVWDTGEWPLRRSRFEARCSGCGVSNRDGGPGSNDSHAWAQAHAETCPRPTA